jgi:hypothetical protein
VPEDVSHVQLDTRFRRQQLDAIPAQSRRVARPLFSEREPRCTKRRPIGFLLLKGFQLLHSPLCSEVRSADRQMESAAGHEGPGGLTLGDGVKSLAAFEGPLGFTIPSSQRSLIALAPRSCRSALWANALECIPADCPDFAPRFSSERTKPSVVQLSGRQHDFERHWLDRSESVTGIVPLGFGI